MPGGIFYNVQPREHFLSNNKLNSEVPMVGSFTQRGDLRYPVSLSAAKRRAILGPAYRRELKGRFVVYGKFDRTFNGFSPNPCPRARARGVVTFLQKAKTIDV